MKKLVLLLALGSLFLASCEKDDRSGIPNQSITESEESNISYSPAVEGVLFGLVDETGQSPNVRSLYEINPNTGAIVQGSKIDINQGFFCTAAGGSIAPNAIGVTGEGFMFAGFNKAVSIAAISTESGLRVPRVAPVFANPLQNPAITTVQVGVLPTTGGSERIVDVEGLTLPAPIEFPGGLDNLANFLENGGFKIFALTNTNKIYQVQFNPSNVQKFLNEFFNDPNATEVCDKLVSNMVEVFDLSGISTAQEFKMVAGKEGLEVYEPQSGKVHFLRYTSTGLQRSNTESSNVGQPVFDLGAPGDEVVEEAHFAKMRISNGLLGERFNYFFGYTLNSGGTLSRDLMYRTTNRTSGHGSGAQLTSKEPNLIDLAAANSSSISLE